MKFVPKFLTGGFRIFCAFALQQAVSGGDDGDDVRQTRGWWMIGKGFFGEAFPDVRRGPVAVLVPIRPPMCSTSG